MTDIRCTRRWAAKSATASDIKAASACLNFWKAARIWRKRFCAKRRRSRLREVAQRQEMVTMQQDGILKVLEGKTTFEEVEGATGDLVW